MAYETRRSSRARRARQAALESEQLANRRIRGLRADFHPYRWCPAQEVSILVGPDYLCPACGELTTAT